jgi:hypothetical protein
MDREVGNVRERLRTPRSAAIAGIVFSLLLMVSLILIRLSVPANSTEPGLWIANPVLSNIVILALYMVPFSGIAFLWFIGVIRDLIGEQEDKFFSTVFLGSGLLFVAMLFASAAVAGGLLASFSAMSSEQVSIKSRHIQLRPRCNLLYFERIRHENRRSFHHIHMYNWA